MKILISSRKSDDNDLIKFAESDLKQAGWIDGKEFFLNGKLYDVLKIKISGNERIFYCVFDAKETKIDKLQKDLSNNLYFKSPLKQLSRSTDCKPFYTNYFIVNKAFYSFQSQIFDFLRKRHHTLVDGQFQLIYTIDIPPKIYC